MQGVIHFFTGSVRLEITCAEPEQMLNRLAEAHIPFWDTVRVDAVTIALTMSPAYAKRLGSITEQSSAEVRQISKRGLPVFFRKVRKRYALLAGLVLVLTAVWVSSLYIWDIRVTGTETVQTAEILSALRDVGVDIGTFGPDIDPELVRNEVLLQLGDVVWLTVNVTGSRATVIVRERIHPPQRFEEGVPTTVYATRAGVIDQMIIRNGAPLVEEGQTVELGEDLITGRMDSLAAGTRLVRADAQIFARTWYELSMSMPLEYVQKVPTGEIVTKRTIFFGQRRINLFFDTRISYANYDKIVELSDFVLPGGLVLPFRVERRVYTEYQPTLARMDETRAALLLQEWLLAHLDALMVPGGVVTSTEFTVEVGDGIVTVHLEAEGREQIAAIRNMRADEMVILPPITEETEEIP
ncbi:MAG: sporulation protein YqfD [Oscillospiraceae bacterium]|nr:sporulation protein YqfD [Oscillospiraceae bacterium]